jgi:hypothetical protein
LFHHLFHRFHLSHFGLGLFIRTKNFNSDRWGLKRLLFSHSSVLPIVQPIELIHTFKQIKFCLFSRKEFVAIPFHSHVLSSSARPTHSLPFFGQLILPYPAAKQLKKERELVIFGRLLPAAASIANFVCSSAAGDSVPSQLPTN